MRTFPVLILCILLFPGCNNRYKYWNISRFNMVDTALKDREEIKLLYSSRGPDNNENLEYLIHIVAVSKRTGDTVNILTTVENGFSIEDKDKVFNYFDQDNVVSNLMVRDAEKLKGTGDISESVKKEIKKIQKVARDPKYDGIADNKYPTVIGTIGTVK